MIRWFLNKLLKSRIAKERKNQIKKGWSKDSDQHKGVMNLIIIARQYHERGKFIQALALLEAATEVQNADFR